MYRVNIALNMDKCDRIKRTHIRWKFTLFGRNKNPTWGEKYPLIRLSRTSSNELFPPPAERIYPSCEDFPYFSISLKGTVA